jgi:type I restriction enzyme M protein
VLFPHGVLFRNEERQMRAKLVDSDLLECVLGLGPGLFYNSPMEASVVVCRTRKPDERKDKVLFINAVNEYAREQAQSFLRERHIETILDAYRRFEEIPGLAHIATRDEIRNNHSSLNIPLYVGNGNPRGAEGDAESLSDAVGAWDAGTRDTREALAHFIELLRTEVARG